MTLSTLLNELQDLVRDWPDAEPRIEDEDGNSYVVDQVRVKSLAVVGRCIVFSSHAAIHGNCESLEKMLEVEEDLHELKQNNAALYRQLEAAEKALAAATGGNGRAGAQEGAGVASGAAGGISGGGRE